MSIITRIRKNLADPASHHRKIALAFIRISVFVLLGKLAGAAKEMTIAWKYGVSETVDAYVFIMNLVNWPISVWFSILTVVLIPLYARLHRENPEELHRFQGEMFAFTLMVGVVMGGVFSAGFPALLATGKIGLSGEAMRKAVSMAWPMGLVLPMGLNISLFSAWMMAGSRHRNTLLEALPALLNMIALFLPSAWISEPLVFGTVAGFLLQMVALAFPLQRSGDLPRPGFGFRSEVWSGFWQSIGILSIGQLMTSFTNVIDQFYAAGLDTGSLSTLSYANRVLSLLFSMGAMAISRATLPIFSEVHAQQDSVVKKIALRWSTLMFFIGTGVMIAGILGGPLIIRTLFERGAFTSENTMFVADVFRNSLFQVPFYFAGLVLVSALASTKQYRKIAFVGAFNLVSKMLFAYLLVGSLHLNGLVVSTALMYLVSMILLYVFVRF